MEIVLLTVNLVLLLVLLFLFIGRRQTKQWDELQTVLRQQMQENREELNRSIRELRMEITQTLSENIRHL